MHTYNNILTEWIILFNNLKSDIYLFFKWNKLVSRTHLQHVPDVERQRLLLAPGLLWLQDD